jgi:hypothetical protein
MGAPISEDLRVHVIEAVEKGSTRRQAAHRFGVSVARDPLGGGVASERAHGGTAARWRSAVGSD